MDLSSVFISPLFGALLRFFAFRIFPRYQHTIYFAAVIPEGGEGFENGDWIEIAITVGNDVENGNGLYVSKEFIREENGQKFVYIRDENDKLKKQNVVTGKLLWGSYYEVKSGLSEEDYIAFPYGKTVVEGADTKESSSSDYYNS